MQLSIRSLPRFIFFFGLASMIFWSSGFVIEPTVDEDPLRHGLILLGLAMAMAWGVSSLLFRAKFLTVPAQLPVSKMLLTLLGRVVLCYVVVAFLLAAAGSAFIALFGKENLGADADIAVIIGSLWVPVWIAPLAGAIWCHNLWRRMDKA